MSKNNFPKLHNATWPGIVGKGDHEPIISLDELLEKTAKAEVNGVKFDGVDLGLFDPHVKLDTSDDHIKSVVDKIGGTYGLAIGTLVAPIWPPDGGSAMGSQADRDRFVEVVRKAAEFGYKLRKEGIRTNNVIRVDSASSVEEWAKNPTENTKLIADTFRRACDAAAEYGERLAAEGEICWGGMQSWKTMLETLEMVDRDNMGFQADMSHTFLYLLGYNAPDDRILKPDFQWDDREELERGLKFLTSKLRPWTIDFHVAQNDGTVFGSGSHDKTGRHCLPTDPNGRLDIAKDAGFWMKDENGNPTKAFNHICWDGCMFPNEVMHKQETWDSILKTLNEVREVNGWSE